MRTPSLNWALSWGKVPGVASTLREFVGQGQLANALPPQFDEEDWASAAVELAGKLQIDPARTSNKQARRVFHYYLPVMFWLLQLQQQATRLPLVVGLSAPQGCGKTTMTTHLTQLLNSRSVRTVAVSIDDFYLTGAEQDAVATAHADNPLLQMRGNAGTHDVPLALQTLQLLREAGPNTEVRIPRYDKSARSGRGDRAGTDEWSVHRGPCDVILLEGWMLGFKPLPPSSPKLRAAAGLSELNSLLHQYRPLHESIDAWVVVQIANKEWVRSWRQGAEAGMIYRGKTGMTPAQVDAFVDAFMPAYTAYLPGLYRKGPQCLLHSESGQRKPLLQIALDQYRRPKTPAAISRKQFST